MDDYNFSEDQERWLKALENGEYQQCTGELCAGDSYCCLGVACILDGYKKADQLEHPGYFLNHQGTLVGGAVNGYLRDKLNLIETNGALKVFFKKDPELPDNPVNWITSLASMNDDGWSFKKIAEYIRANPRNVFRDQQD